MSFFNINVDEKLGSKIEAQQSLSDIIQQCRLDFQLEKQPIYDKEGKIIKDNFLIRNVTDNVDLGIVGKKYEIVPVESMLEPFDKLVRDNGLIYENAGVIGDGAKCWVSARFEEPLKLKFRPTDLLENRIIALISNDSSYKNSFISLNKRVFCNNQFKQMTAQSADGLRIQHTVNHQRKIDRSVEIIQNCLTAGQKFVEKADYLNDKLMTESEARDFVDKLFPTKTRTKQAHRTEHKKLMILELFRSGQGNIGKTRWDMFNGVTEFFDHHNNTKKIEKFGRPALERRFVTNLIFGEGVQTKSRALELLLK